MRVLGINLNDAPVEVLTAIRPWPSSGVGRDLKMVVVVVVNVMINYGKLTLHSPFAASLIAFSGVMRRMLTADPLYIPK
jgi:hypothetical protein